MRPTTKKTGEIAMKTFKIRLALGASALTLLSAGAASAQDAETATQIDEIIVTAQKRSENLQTVPVAVSVNTGEDLRDRNISNIDQLQTIVPSFQSSPFGTSIRGVGTSTFSTSIEPTVSTVVDGVVLGRPEMALGSFYDIAQVEVLRGPQGMLFGKNASAGVVSIVTNRPNLDGLFAAANISLGEDGYNRSDATVNLPLGDRVALRVGGFVNELDGVIHNNFDGRSFNGNDEWGTRARLLWVASDNVEVLLTADYMKQDQSITWSPYALGAGSPFTGAYAFCGVTPSPENDELCIDGPQYKDRENYGFTGQVDWSLGNGLTLTSITAARRATDLSSGDSDSLPVNLLNTNISDQWFEQFSQEFRLTSPQGARLEYVAGLYYFSQETRQVTEQTGTFGLPLPPGFFANSTINSLVEGESAAVFGQLKYALTDSLALIAGVRFTHDTLSLDFNQFNLPGTLGVNPTVSRVDDTTEDNVSWRLGLQYQVAPRVMLYGTVARGYKGPGFNQTGVSNATASQYVGPEIPTSFEIGAKTTLFDGRVLLNLAAFHTEFEDYQAQTLDRSVTPAAFRTINAGDLETQGVEADFIVRLAEGLTLTGAAAWIDARYGDFAPISCYPGQTVAQGCVVVAPGFPPFVPPTTAYDASGEPLSGVPDWKGTMALRYERPVFSGLKLNALIDWSWRSEVNASANGDPNTVIDGFSLFGFNVGVGAEDESWRLSAWGKNVGDQRYPSALFGPPFGGPGDYAQVLTGDAFQRFGVTLNLRY